LQSFGQHQAFLPQECVPDKLKFLYQNYFCFETFKSIFEKDVKKNFRAFPEFFAGMKVKSVLGGQFWA
jgi:hypothetical protein